MNSPRAGQWNKSVGPTRLEPAPEPAPEPTSHFRPSTRTPTSISPTDLEPLPKNRTGKQKAHAPYTSLHTLSLIQLPLDVEVNVSGAPSRAGTPSDT